MKKNLLSIAIFILCSNYSYAAATYKETPDDFSNDVIYSLTIPSLKGGSTILIVACQPKNKLNIQFATTKTMFPDDTSSEGMIISTTHKFDKAEEAITSNWHMNMMKYNNSWFSGNKPDFINDAIRSNQLNLRLNKRSDVFKFSLKGTASNLKKIIAKCSQKI